LFSLNHPYTLRGLHRPNIYETPLDPRKNSLKSARKKSGQETHSRGSLLPGMVRSSIGPIIDTPVNTGKTY
jgi:hypothetical protein